MAGPAPKAGAQTLPLVTVAPKAASVTEGDVATFTLTAAPTPTAELNVHVVVTPVPRDFVGPPVLVGGQRGDRWVKFPANATTTDFTVATANDDIDEAGQQILVHAGRGEGDYRIEETNIIWLDILDNDDPAVSFDSATYDVDEGDAVTLTLDVVLPQGTATTVNVACAAGTTSASEFSGCPSSVIVPANMGSHTFTVQTAEDAADEVAETFTVTLSLPDGTTGLRVHPHAAATVTVADDDDPAVSFDSATYDVDEGDAVTLTLNVVRPQGTATTVNVACAAGTTSASEFSGCPSSVTVPANMGSHTFTVQTAEDESDEVAETFTVTLSLPDGTTGLRVHPHAAATVTVADDDRPAADPAVNLSVSNSGAASEGGSALTITATRSEANNSGATLSIPIRVKADGTTADAADYTLASSIDIANTASSGTTAFTVVDDGLDEPQERVVVELGALPAGTVPGPGSEVTITIADNDGGTPPVDPPPVDPPPGGGGGGGGSGGGGGTAAEVRIRDAAPAVEGSPLRFRIELGSPAARRLDLLADTAAGTAADGADYLGLRSHAVTVEEGEPGAWLEVRTARDAAADEGEERLTVTLSAAPGSAPVRVPRPQARGTILDGPPPEAAVPLFPAHAEARHGFVRVLDRGWRGGPVSIAAVDGGGVAAADSTLRLAPGGAAHFRSSELEGGSAAKGLAPGTGAPTRGGWRLLLSGADVAAAAYARVRDGFVTPLAGTLPAEADGRLFAAFLNPASNWRQRSLLRLRNPGPGPVRVAVSGTDDAGASPGTPVSLTLAGGAARTLTAAELERGAPGLDGALGDGAGKWRLSVAADGPVEAMGLLESPTGHLANLSAATAPRAEAADGTARTLAPLFPSASDPDGRQGFLRIVNRGAEPAEMRIEARDDAGRAHPALSLAVGAGAAVHLNSHDLEQGNARKGLPLGTGPGGGSWRLELAGPSEVVALAYLRHRDGFVTGMNALAPLVGGTHRVDFLNPGSNHRQVGALRLMNPGAEDATARVTGVDDAGAPGGPVAVTVPAWRAVELTAAELEAGAADAGGPAAGTAVEGALGDGAGKWRLRVASDRPLRVMGLLESPTGHLANLSAGAWAPAELDGAAPADGGR